jgi:hypothetical protein
MADMHRRGPEPPPGMPQIQFKPGLADEMLRELAPLLAEEGIDVDNIDVPDLPTLQRALDRAVERRNMQLFSPVGQTRDIALVSLRLIVEAILDGDTAHAGALLDQIQPESPDNSTATVASCIGIALGLLDDWLSGQAHDPPASANTPFCRPGIGPVNAPRQTSSASPARAERSARWTNCSSGKAARKCWPAPRSRSPQPSTPGPSKPTLHEPS